MEKKIEKIQKLSKTPGHHTVMVYSKTPITQTQIQRLVSPSIRCHVSKRSLGEDVLMIWPVHLLYFFLSCGLNAFVLGGMGIYEKYKPLYIVDLYVPEGVVHINPILEFY